MGLPSETRDCEQCGKKMIDVWTGAPHAVFSSLHAWEWWCGCGNRQEGAAIENITLPVTRRWEKANAEAEAEPARPGPYCNMCRFFHRNGPGGAHGLCRRRAPTLAQSGDRVECSPFRPRFPRMKLHDWCGEYEQDSNS